MSRPRLMSTVISATHPMPSARGKLYKTPSESRLSLPPIEHMKLCLFKLESADYVGAIFDVTQCTAFLSHSPEPDLKKIRFCVAYKLALTILSEVRRRMERDTSALHEARRSMGATVTNKGPSSSTDTSPNESPSTLTPATTLSRRNTELLGPPNESLLIALLEEERNTNDERLGTRSLPGSLFINNTAGAAPLPPGLTAPQYIALLTRFLAEIPLLPRHRMVCYRMAIKWNMECSNYETAARLIRVLLKKKLPDLSELEAKLKVCEENRLHDEVPVLDAQVMCCKSLRLTESYTQCKVCDVRYSDDIVQPTVCIFCMMGRIAAQKDRFSPRIASKEHL